MNEIRSSRRQENRQLESLHQQLSKKIMSQWMKGCDSFTLKAITDSFLKFLPWGVIHYRDTFNDQIVASAMVGLLSEYSCRAWIVREQGNFAIITRDSNLQPLHARSNQTWMMGQREENWNQSNCPLCHCTNFTKISCCKHILFCSS